MKSLLAGLSLSVLALGCVAEEPSDGIDEQRLAAYRAALPTRAELSATAPQPSMMNALGDPAFYPHASFDIVVGINGTVGATIDLLDLITSTPPTVYNSDTREFVWGPYPDELGYTAAYIRETEAGADFRYEFAFVRGIGPDLATLTPIVWGGATPDPEDDTRGVGVTMWDLTAARAFAEAHDPAFDPAEHDSGRFVALYGKGPAEDDPAAEMTFVVAVFRDFIAKDAPDAEPVDLDYLYGRYATAEHSLDFIDYQANLDVTEPADGVTEDVGVRMAFLDEGTGRAEADAANGSLGDGELVEVVECWDAAITQTYVDFDGVAQLGDVSACGLFQPSLTDMGIPSLADIDPSLLAVLDHVATHGAE